MTPWRLPPSRPVSHLEPATIVWSIQNGEIVRYNYYKWNWSPAAIEAWQRTEYIDGHVCWIEYRDLPEAGHGQSATQEGRRGPELEPGYQQGRSGAAEA
jgi:hypothetical protein